MKKSNFCIWLVIVLLWLAVIFGHSAMPAAVSDSESLGLLAVLQRWFPALTNHLLRKLGHFSEYLVLGVFLSCLFRYARNFILLKPLACGLLAALCDETLQLYVPGRSGQVTDVWIDLAGAVCGCLLIWSLSHFRSHRSR